MRQSIQFARRGGRLVVGSSGGVAVIDVVGASPPVTIPVADLHDFVALDAEIWAVAGTSPALRRFGLDAGAPIGDAFALAGSGSAGALSTAASGGSFAVWSGPPAVSLAADLDGVTAVAIPGEHDQIVPIGRYRWLTCRRGQLRLRDLTTERWCVTVAPPDREIRSGAALFDGRSAALEIAPASASDGDAVTQLAVLSLRDGAVHHRISLTGVTAVRIAAQRGYALALAGRRLILVDLRFGHVVVEHECEREPSDIAIDPAAQHLAMRVGEGDQGLVCLSVRELIAAAQTRAIGGAVDDEPTTAAAAPRIVVETGPPAAATAPRSETVQATAFQVGHAPLVAMPALGPRAILAEVTRAENDELLRRYHALVTSLGGRAIAMAWDRGRLTYPNQGAHPFQDEVNGLLGQVVGRAATERATADRLVAEAIAAVQVIEQLSAPRTPPLLALAAELGVSPLGRTILLLVAGPTLWGDLARLYGILANDQARELVDEWLIGQLLSPQVDAQTIARELDRDQPLVRYGLVRISGNRMRPFAGLSCDPIVLKLLRSAPVDAELDEDVRVVASTRSFDELLIPAPVKDALLRDLAALTGDPTTTRLVVRGRVGSGRHTVLATVAAAANRRLGVIDVAPLARDGRALADRLRVALRRAHVVGLLPCVDGLDALASDDQAAREAVREVLRRHPGPLAVRLPRDAQPPLDPGHVLIDLPALSVSERLTCWQASLTAHRLIARDVLELATRYAIGPGVIERVCAGVDGGERTPDDDHGQRLDVAVRQHLENRLGTIASRVTRLTSWPHVVLPPDIQDSLLELIARISHRGLVYDTWGFDAVMSTTRGVTALFQGGPGTGKTMVAGAIANELGMDLYRVDLSRVMSKWIGETEQNLAKLFDAAEDGHAIILFDEADSLFAKRTEVRTSVDRYANLEVNYLLQRLDTFEGIAILTTNFGTGIDSAFRRRLSFRLTFPFPDEEMRELLWKAHLPAAAPTAGDFDLAELARRYRLSGGYIRNAALRAAFLAAEERSPITQDHLERAIKAEFREIGKLADSGVLE